MMDVILILKVLVGLDSPLIDLSAADMDGDGQVGLHDALYILIYASR
jgi:hypothetical protein